MNITREINLSGRYDHLGTDSNLKNLWDKFNKPSQSVPSGDTPQQSKQDMIEARPQESGFKCPVSMSSIVAKLNSNPQPDRQVVLLETVESEEPVEVTVSPKTSDERLKEFDLIFNY